MSDTGLKHGVVFVHGIGSQHQSDILLDIGGSLFDWLAIWHAARGEHAPPLPGMAADTPTEPAPRINRSALNFSPTEESPPSLRSHATITLGNGDCWEMTEAWWASEYRRQQLGPMALWTLQHLRYITVSLWRAFVRRLHDPEGDGASVGPIRRTALAMYTLGTLVLFFIGAIIGLPVVCTLLLLAQIPIPQVRAVFIVALQPFLEVNIGEFRTICEDELQAANMRRVVAEMVLDLVKCKGCGDVTIVAHSGGAVVAFDMLADPVHAEAASHVRKFITAGSGMNKAWAIARGRELQRLLRPIRCNVHWLDLWGTFDPVPQGWIVPPILRSKSEAAEVFNPSPHVVAAQGLQQRANADPFSTDTTARGVGSPRYWPTSVEVTNALSILADHGGYWQNYEEVVARVAAEIDAEYYRDSRYWHGEDRPLSTPEEKHIRGYKAPEEKTVARTIRQRRERVITLAMWRGALIALWLLTAFIFRGRTAGWLRAHGDWFPFPNWLTMFAHSSVGASLQTILIASHLVAALMIGVPFLIAFLVVQSWWRNQNVTAMRKATCAIARAHDLTPGRDHRHRE